MPKFQTGRTGGNLQAAGRVIFVYYLPSFGIPGNPRQAAPVSLNGRGASQGVANGENTTAAGAGCIAARAKLTRLDQ